MPVPFDPKLVSFIRRILSVAETGKPEWDASAVYKYNDGPGGTAQWTLSIGFTEMGGNLKKVLQCYIDNGGTKSVQFAGYMPVIGKTHITDPGFKPLLIEAGKDPIMVKCQQDLFEKLYLNPAFAWAESYGFALPLSYLVIADSFLHSGSMLGFLTNSFPEKKPSTGGESKPWINAYLKARRNWLAGHSNRLLRNTVYRCDCYMAQSKKDNWDLAQVPVVMNGTSVYPA